SQGLLSFLYILPYFHVEAIAYPSPMVIAVQERRRARSSGSCSETAAILQHYYWTIVCIS
ncbi:hypothetical protein, partial [Sphingobacterium sp. UBA7855]|uniref:hypothetical protein n=1 Tax=Sphingobacterium sp. UBA7855 TaxID=1947526 RepID=UPI0025F94CB2